jgi:hypothetical protein
MTSALRRSGSRSVLALLQRQSAHATQPAMASNRHESIDQGELALQPEAQPEKFEGTFPLTCLSGS